MASVTIVAIGVDLNTGTITFTDDGGLTPLDLTDDDPLAVLSVTGDEDINITSVDTSDVDITAISVLAVGFTGTLTAPGTSPGFLLDNTESLSFDNDRVTAGTITLGDDVPVNAGVAGNTLSIINAVEYDGTLNLGIIAQIDSTNDDSTPLTPANDGLLRAFTFTSGDGLTTMTLDAANGRTPQLNTGSEWRFDYSTTADPGSYLTITDDVIFQAGSILTLNNVPLIIEGDVDFTEVILAITGGSINVPAGQSLTLTVAQVLALTVDIEGDGTVVVIGDGTDASAAVLGENLKTVGVDLSAVTLLPADVDDLLAITLTGALDDNGDPAGQNVIGSANDDAITSTSAEDDTFSGGLGDDTLNAGAGANTFIVTSGTDTIIGLNGLNTLLSPSDVLVVSAGATAEADLGAASTTAGSFVATAATVNNGTVVLTDVDVDMDSTIDMTLATGANGFTITGGTSATLGADTLIGSAQADIINGGNTEQTAAAAKDTLTGLGGDDEFVFNIATSNPVDPLLELTPPAVAGVDEELITVTADAPGDDDDDESITITYVLNGVAAAIIVDNDPALNTTDANAVAAAIAAALEAVNGLSATAAANVVTVVGDDGNSVTLVGGSATISDPDGIPDLDAVYSNGTDTPQDIDLTIAPGVVVDEVYSVLVTLAEGQIIGVQYTAVFGDDETDVAFGLVTAFNTVAAAVTVDASNVLGVMTFLDENADNGGFTLVGAAAGAVIGSGASALGAPTLATADVITDFVSGDDTVSFAGLPAGENANYTEALLPAADYATALALAELAIGGSVIYYLTSSTADATGLLFFDANDDGDVDGVVSLTGITRDDFAFGDIVAG